MAVWPWPTDPKHSPTDFHKLGMPNFFDAAKNGDLVTVSKMVQAGQPVDEARIITQHPRRGRSKCEINVNFKPVRANLFFSSIFQILSFILVLSDFK